MENCNESQETETLFPDSATDLLLQIISHFSFFLFFISVWIFLLYTLSKVGDVCFNALSPGLVWTPILSETSNENKREKIQMCEELFAFYINS